MFNKTIYPLSKASIEQRDNENFLRDASERTGGLKGHTILNRIAQFPDSAPLDYMHLLFEGLFLNMLNHWFDSSNSNQPYYISKFWF